MEHLSLDAVYEPSGQETDNLHPFTWHFLYSKATSLVPESLTLTWFDKQAGKKYCINMVLIFSRGKNRNIRYYTLYTHSAFPRLLHCHSCFLDKLDSIERLLNKEEKPAYILNNPTLRWLKHFFVYITISVNVSKKERYFVNFFLMFEA